MSSLTEHPAVWARTDVPEGLGLGALLPEPDGHRLEAGETVVVGGERFLTRFSVRTDLAWTTRRVYAEVLSSQGLESVTLDAHGGHWSGPDGVPRPELVGCLDVDVAATPLTNTLPIRRLGLRHRASGRGGSGTVLPRAEGADAPNVLREVRESSRTRYPARR
ncbi:putative glycolipid-binding domain-containing protein, partial [Nocardiopsis sp. RV163]|uniref:putative glycolipid-binding domain-containing protein n=1 Tax=Nocardiopsis sp. RV163 TaxID=1661388 RepID=UPI001F28634C